MTSPDIWARAGAAIDKTFGVEIIYTGAGLTGAPITAIKQDSAASSFLGPGDTLRRITYEVDQADLPQAPTKKNTFVHGGIRWQVDDITKRDDIGKWELVVVDTGPAT